MEPRIPISGILSSFIFLFLICLTGTEFNKTLCQGDPCTINGLPGTGTYLRKCIPVLNDFRNGSPISVIGYYFFEPIVCCPLNGSITKSNVRSTTPITTPTESPSTTPTESSSTTKTTTATSTQQPSTTTPITTPTESPSTTPIVTPTQLPTTTPTESSSTIKTTTATPTQQPSTTTPMEPRNNELFGCVLNIQHIVLPDFVVQSIDEFPYMIAIYVAESGIKKFRCGGSLITSSYIVTAAHCTYGKSINEIYILTGVSDLDTVKNDTNATYYQIIEKIEHPNYVHGVAYHDIALLKLKTQVGRLNVCLFRYPPKSVSETTAVGWGQTAENNSTLSSRLLGVNLLLVPNDICNKLIRKNRELPNGITDEQLCAGGNGKDTCYGDSGSPLTTRSGSFSTTYLIGIVSYGIGCGKNPGVYTRVSSYNQWMSSIIGPNS